MKQHRFWAWGAVICLLMVMITGYKTAHGNDYRIQKKITERKILYEFIQ